ncbi:methionine ABC transporter substrate-binding protein [Paenibacillus swuensis]|uniref:Lipoprotein n=1 Tax=Paenibacillus swuensis TaxID=1178515 RepID=A0A172TJN3_9BACL|nr:MetQ/NlpA family ABC transporter substrate-binding protein [Paenibacillus swuensis]ANE46993.1 methionine ABC transporter substrate-binding protein [Paenibacillus swuensis]
MKKSLLALLFMALIVLTACGQNNNAGNNEGANTGAANGGNTGEAAEPVKLVVGATAVPHAEILKEVQPLLKEQGVELEIKEFTDYVQPNVQVFEKELDANFFQHMPYLEEMNTGKKMDLVEVIGVHIEPFGAYSKKVKSVDELKDGARVAIPNDPSNAGRALALLEKNGLIKMKAGVGIAGTVKDIEENSKNLKIEELEAAMLPRVVDEMDLALINTNYALEAGLNPMKDALFIEGNDSPYVNILVSRPDNKDSEAMQKLAKALTSPEVKAFIEEKYKGAVIAAF